MSSEFLSTIGARRDGRGNTRDQLTQLANGAADGSIPDYQLAAWLMAAYLNPLGAEETAWLTLAMADSGERLDLTGLPKPWVDKHSTGGVGDKTSIVVLPLLAACGLTIVKMSGRGLGITGGTVDKLASILGFRVNLTPDEMKAQAARIGIALTGQGPELAPADKTLYALRDVTGTVGSIPLIVSSILSKKIAGGAETIVLDVKAGSGAFMKTLKDAQALARALQDTAQRCGLKIRLTISDMSEPLGSSVGNALEVQEALDVLNPSLRAQLKPPTLRFRELCVSLAAHTLEASGISPSQAAGLKLVNEALSSGAAYEKAFEWFRAQGVEDFGTEELKLPISMHRLAVKAPELAGMQFVSQIQCDAIGQAVVDLGGGRKVKTDNIDPSVGLELCVGVGSKVRTGDDLFVIHAATTKSAETAKTAVLNAFKFSTDPVTPPPVILEVI